MVCGDSGCGLVVPLLSECLGLGYISRQLPPVRKEPAFPAGLAVVPRSHNIGQ